MASGLAFVHSNRHVHRDIYPANILISSDGNRLIISDFGLVKQVRGSGSFSVSNPTHGMQYWLAPERIQRMTDSNYRVTIDCDTFSLGCVF